MNKPNTYTSNLCAHCVEESPKLVVVRVRDKGLRLCRECAPVVSDEVAHYGTVQTPPAFEESRWTGRRWVDSKKGARIGRDRGVRL